MAKKILFLLGAVLVLSAQACTRHSVEVAPVKVEPIHITIDVNIRVDRDLDDFFGDLDEATESSEEAPAPSEEK